jgi:hypothetical protein
MKSKGSRAGSRVKKRLRLAWRAWFDSLVVGACRESWVWRAPRSHRVGSPPNKRMHPTADTRDVKFLRGVARRVMRSVGRLVAEHREQRFTGRITCGKRLRLAWRAWFDSLVADARRRSRAWRAPRYPRLVSPPNKRMHATADTTDVKSLLGCGAARDARRYTA